MRDSAMNGAKFRCGTIVAIVSLVVTNASAQNSSLMHPSQSRSQPQAQRVVPATMRTEAQMQLRPPAQLSSMVQNGVPAPPPAQVPADTRGPVNGQSRTDSANAGQIGGAPSSASRDGYGPPQVPYAPQDVPYGYYGPQGVAQAGYQDRPPVMLDSASWTYQPAPPLRVFQKQDVVTIRVDEIARVMAEGNIDNRKRTLYDAIVTDWIKISKFRVKPDPQEDGDPAVGFQSQSNYRADSSVESREAMTFNIAATVVDIRPNGNLVLEARKAIRINDNLWETSLTGMCRAQDIGPDNIVLSKDVIDLEIRKDDRGHMRDGYSRGWLQRWLDRYGPF